MKCFFLRSSASIAGKLDKAIIFNWFLIKEPLSPNNQFSNSFSPQHSNYNHQSQLSSPSSSHLSSPSHAQFDYNIANFPQQPQQHYQPAYAQPAFLNQPQQHQQQSPLSPNFSNPNNFSGNETANSGNFLNVNIQCTGGSLPDLTSFQFQQNHPQQNFQLHDYQHQANTPKIRNHSQSHQGQHQSQYDQLLQVTQLKPHPSNHIRH